MLPSYYEYYNPVKILSGKKALDNLPFELNQLGAKRPMIITDKGVSSAGLLKYVKGAFAETDMLIGAIFEDVPADSSLETVKKIAEIYRENQCDSLVAVGGGSPIDTTKAANIIITENSENLLKFAGSGVLEKKMLPMIVVPTTSGTGSEVTLVAVIADTQNDTKLPFSSSRLLPNVAILDPRMTITMPARITAATGMDALTHAMEAYICLQKNPLSDAYAHAAISLIRDHLRKAIEKPKDIESRMAMANAATMAGTSFSNSMVGIVHALGHSTGGISHVPSWRRHVYILALYGLEYNCKKVVKYIGELLLPLGGAEDYASTPPEKRSERSDSHSERVTTGSI